MRSGGLTRSASPAGVVGLLSRWFDDFTLHHSSNAQVYLVRHDTADGPHALVGTGAGGDSQ